MGTVICIGCSKICRVRIEKENQIQNTFIFIFFFVFLTAANAQSILPFCNDTLTIAQAIHRVTKEKTTLQSKKRKLIISIGTTDLRENHSLCDMRRDFTALFLLCDEFNLKPLITTIICFDTPYLKKKADIFNQFLLECFDNVIDLSEVMKTGLSGVMTAMNKKLVKLFYCLVLI